MKWVRKDGLKGRLENLKAQKEYSGLVNPLRVGEKTQSRIEKLRG